MISDIILMNLLLGGKGLNKKDLPKVAYFCMEYGLDSRLKTYAGGLGILAGDYLKGAKDYGFPIIGIGIKWKQGYTDQVIGKEGKPIDTYPNYTYDYLKDTGISVTVKIRQRDVICKVWLLDEFSNAPIYLLDTDVPENKDPWITGQLYGWFAEERIAQEMVLGIGGIKALRTLGIDIDIYHFNEGHAVFAAFELIKEKMDKGIEFEEAITKTQEEVVFTTHTPVIQGNESHYLDCLMYMGANNSLTLENLVSIGGAPFNMTVAALRLSKISNAVSKLHMETANKMWKYIDNRSEIIGITNAIHIPTWIDERTMEEGASGEDLWNAHMDNKRNLIEFIKKRNNVTLNEDKLLIGFSRRAVPYKRSNFIFSDLDVMDKYLKDGRIQIVFSGKAHPLDDTGKEIVEDILSMTKRYPNSVVFLENYDMEIGKMLTQGADVWLNNPRRPQEASGTSGMKAAMNGVLNFSILDGWWPEACKHGINGWQFGDGFESDDVLEQDKHDLECFYEVLFNEVIPTYYDDKYKWKDMMKESINSTKEYFSVRRMLDEYYELMYKK